MGDLSPAGGSTAYDDPTSRTRLAWSRTVLITLVVGALGVRAGIVERSPLLLALVAAPVVVIVVVSLLRMRRLAKEGTLAGRSSRRAVLTLAVCVMLLSALGVWASPTVSGATPAAERAAPTSQQSELTALEVPYSMGTVRARTVWVDPRGGSDAADGRTRDTALRTLAEAWRRIPQGEQLSRGVRIRVTPGTLTADDVPNYLESRYGTRRHPIIVQAADGPGTVTLPALNVYDVRYLYLLDLTLRSPAGDAFHCERCDHVLIRGATIRGMPAASGAIGDLVKVNQSQHVHIERSDISGASDNAVDLVAVQYASLRDNVIHDAQDWCAYAKGGSAYVRVVGNEIHDCGTGGFTAGQGTGFQFMVAPWLHYEAYDVAVVNNVVHDVEGAGLGVNGGYNVLIAHNTLYRVGSRSHLLEFVPGGRSCDGRPGDEGRGRCAEYLAAGGWGTTRVGDGSNYVRIPNRHVYVVNNLVLNPTGASSRWQHLEVAAPYTGRWQRGSNVPTPTRFDDDLRIEGNVIWDGPADLPRGLGA
ncbi:MAG: right-handed parallel beta-helix repeat-containing protein [bacterium]